MVRWLNLRFALDLKLKNFSWTVFVELNLPGEGQDGGFSLLSGELTRTPGVRYNIPSDGGNPPSP